MQGFILTPIVYELDIMRVLSGSYTTLALYMAHINSMYMIEMNQRVLLDTLRFESEGIIH